MKNKEVVQNSGSEKKGDPVCVCEGKNNFRDECGVKIFFLYKHCKVKAEVASVEQRKRDEKQNHPSIHLTPEAKGSLQKH